MSVIVRAVVATELTIANRVSWPLGKVALKVIPAGYPFHFAASTLIGQEVLRTPKSIFECAATVSSGVHFGSNSPEKKYSSVRVSVAGVKL